MDKKKVVFFFLILVLPFVSASVSNLGTFEMGQDINFIQACSSCSFNNITSIISPNSTTLIQDVEMNRTGNNYNYTLNSSFTNEIGKYVVTGIGDVDGVNTIWTFYFYITQTGFDLETSESILYIIILIVTFILFLAFLYPAITISYSNKTEPDGSITRINRAKYLKLLSFWFAYGFLMWFLQTLNAISTSFIKLTYLSNFITNIFSYSQGLSVGITFLILAIIMIEVWKDIFLSQTIKKHGKAFLDGRLM